jgi:heat shock protein HspQ
MESNNDKHIALDIQDKLREAFGDDVDLNIPFKDLVALSKENKAAEAVIELIGQKLSEQEIEISLENLSALEVLEAVYKKDINNDHTIDSEQKDLHELERTPDSKEFDFALSNLELAIEKIREIAKESNFDLSTPFKDLVANNEDIEIATDVMEIAGQALSKDEIKESLEHYDVSDVLETVLKKQKQFAMDSRSAYEEEIEAERESKAPKNPNNHQDYTIGIDKIISAMEELYGEEIDIKSKSDNIFDISEAKQQDLGTLTPPSTPRVSMADRVRDTSDNGRSR